SQSRPRSPSTFSQAGSLGGAGKDSSLLTYFFGPGNTQPAAPPALPPRGPQSEFAATIKRQEAANAHVPQHVTTAYLSNLCGSSTHEKQSYTPIYDEQPLTFVSYLLFLHDRIFLTCRLGGTCSNRLGTIENGAH